MAEGQTIVLFTIICPYKCSRFFLIRFSQLQSRIRSTATIPQCEGCVRTGSWPGWPQPSCPLASGSSCHWTLRRLHGNLQDDRPGQHWKGQIRWGAAVTLVLAQHLQAVSSRRSVPTGSSSSGTSGGHGSARFIFREEGVQEWKTSLIQTHWSLIHACHLGSGVLNRGLPNIIFWLAEYISPHVIQRLRALWQWRSYSNRCDRKS